MTTEILSKIPEMIAIDTLKPHPQNYRKHGPEQVKHIIASIKQNGIYRNVVVANDLTILAGHGVVKSCQELGLKTIPVMRLNVDPNSPLALKVLTGDNEIARLGEVDDRLLTELLKEISNDKTIDGLLGTGFDDMQLANLVFVTRHETEIADFNAAREWVGLPAYDETDPNAIAEISLSITFANAEDRERFVNEHNLKIGGTRGGRKWTTSWPFIERNDMKSVRFEGAAEGTANA